MPNLDRAYDEYITTVESSSPRFEIGKMKTSGIFKTLCDREIKVDLSFWYQLLGDKYSYSDMDQTTYFIDGVKLEWDHPLLERYADEIDDLVNELVSERIAEEA